MLGTVALAQFLPAIPYQSPQIPLLTIVCITGLGIMGLRLPMGNEIFKVLHVSLGFGFILLPTVLNCRWHGPYPGLYLVIVLRSCLMFRPVGRLLVTSLAFLSFLLTLFLQVPQAPAWLMAQERIRNIVLSLKLNATLSFGLSLVFLLLLINALLVECQSQEKLRLAYAQLQKYALRIEDQAALQERNRIARDIHDALGHSLTVFDLYLEAGLRMLLSNPAEATEFFVEAKHLAATALQEVRQSVSALRADPLQGQPLAVAITSLTENFQRSTGVSPTCSIELPSLIPAEVETAIYRIVQEALTNIRKYAAATEVVIQIQATTDLHLMIQDNGRGFELNQNTTGFGLRGMRERTQALEGTFSIITSPAAGCRILANFPLPSY